MTEKYDSSFHRRYLGGCGSVEEESNHMSTSPRVFDMRDSAVLSYEAILKEYRDYVRDPKAELPPELLTQLRIIRTENDQRKK